MHWGVTPGVGFATIWLALTPSGHTESKLFVSGSCGGLPDFNTAHASISGW
jgi:hypothetical protein